MGKAVVLKQHSPASGLKSARVIIYPAVADYVDLPDFSFRKKREEDAFVLLTVVRQKQLLRENAAISVRVEALDDLRLKTLLAPMWPEFADSNITFNITGRRTTILKIKLDGKNIIVEAHWNLFIPYFDQIKTLPIVHSEILDIFANAVFSYAALAMEHFLTPKSELRNLVIESYRNRPDLLLASLDIFNKTNIYHIRPTRIWLGRISAANDRYHLQIDSSSAVAAPLVNPEFLVEVTDFLHKVVKNYAFRYVDYLWTQRYRIICHTGSGAGMVAYENKDVVINIAPLINYLEWKPVLYLSLGYAVMRAILQSSGRDDKKEDIYLAMMKTWNRYLSLDEPVEQQCICDLYGLTQPTREEKCRSLSECMIGPKCTELVDDFIMLMSYSSKETFVERLKVLNKSRYGEKTGIYFEQLWNVVRNLNTSLMKNNINYSKLIEVLRNDNIDHLQLAEFLRTGCLDGRDVVDVSEWHLLRTLLYDLINAPKVFRNDYKMLLKVLTKVNKSLIVYIWTLGLDNDARYEMVSAYIAKLMINIFVFNRVKIYEIVADPVECLEAEAVTGYLLNWAGFTLEERRSIVGEMLSGLPRNVVAHLTVQTAGDVDQLVHVMGTHTSGLFGFYLHQAYRWGSAQDPVTEKIRSYFPELLKQAQGAILPAKRVLGGAMLLLLLAQIISDVRDGFAGNVVVTEEEKQIVCDLISQCVDWDQKHFVIMVAGIAAGYMGSIDGWILQKFDSLLGRYDGGDRVVLRSVVQFDVENLLERMMLTAPDEEENALLNKIKLLRFGVDPVVSDQANKVLRAMATRCGIHSPEVTLKKKDIRELVLALSRQIKAQILCT
ncbi:MAG: hypothetical protein AB2L12_10995 [Smithellaceae bacterium]